MSQPPLKCPTCGFPSVTIGQHRHNPQKLLQLWASCVNCCARREDWEAYLNAEKPA